MSNKKILTRIQNKHDLEVNWRRASFTPLVGELIIYDIEVDASGNVLTDSQGKPMLPDDRATPYTYQRFKMGDGIKPVNDLPFYVLEADNLTFDDDITITTAVGNIALVNGSGTIPAKGKNLRQVFEAIWTKEQEPSQNAPSVSISTGATKVEVGATLSPTYTATLNPGSYTYGIIKADKDAGKTAGVVATGWTVDKGTLTVDATNPNLITVQCPEMTATEGNCYSVTATAAYDDDDAIPATNLGNPWASKQIKAGSKSNTKNLVVGYKPNFYGFKATALNENALTSTEIRQLTSQGATTEPLTSLKATSSWIQLIYAVPKGRKASLKATQKVPPAPYTVKTKEVSVNHVGQATSTYTVFYITLDQAASAGTEIDLEWG